MPELTTRVFITHSSIDQALAEALVDALRLGTGLAADRIFCSSIDGTDVPSGDDFLTYIRDQLQATTLVVPLITPAYLDSLFCMWELGAIWSRGIKMTPIRFDPVTPSLLPELLRHRNVKPLGRPALNAVATAITGQMSVQLNQDLWSRNCDRFLEIAPKILEEAKDDWTGTPAAQLRQRARYGSAIPQLHEALGRIRDAGFAWMSSTELPDRTFKLTLKEFARSMASLFKATTGVAVRVTLKQLIRPDDEGVSGVEALYVEDLVRDRESLRRGRDRVVDNTDFNSIVFFKMDRFFSNDLEEMIASGTYKNSHVSPDEPLKYRSTIVWPVRKIFDSPDDSLGYEMSDGQDLVAFLCVDSPVTGAFSEYDAEIGAGLAAALYPVLRPYLYEELIGPELYGDEQDAEE